MYCVYFGKIVLLVFKIKLKSLWFDEKMMIDNGKVLD